VNAFVFALTVIPVYLLARRLLPRRPSAVVAALSVAIPSSVYIGLVMTDSLAYLVSSVAVLGIVLAVEDATWPKQLGALGAIALATLVRPQFAALLPALLVALALVAAFRPELRRRRKLARLWPTGVVLVAGAALVAIEAAMRGRRVLGDYSFVWRSYSFVGVGRWSEYHAADLALYLGLVPFALLPCVLVALHGRGRRESPRNHAFLAVFCSANAFALLVAGAFGSTSYAQSRLYDRYVFFVIPLWLVAGAVWLRAGAPRPRTAAIVGIAMVLAVIAVFPVDTYVVGDASKQLHAAGTPLWAHLDSWAGRIGQTGHRLLWLAAAAAAVLAYVVPRRRAWTLALPVAAVFLANSVFLWQHNIEDWNQVRAVFGHSMTGERWIDDAVPDDQTVAMLAVGGSGRCADRLNYAYTYSEFFNDRVDQEARVDLPSYGDIPSSSVTVGRNGRLAAPSSRAVTARWWVVPNGVRVNGRLVARGTREHLALWHTDGPVTFAARSNRELTDEACRLRRAA